MSDEVDNKANNLSRHDLTLDSQKQACKHAVNGNGIIENGDATLNGDSIGGCPFMNNTRKPKHKFPEWQTSASISLDPISYREYLQLDKILSAQAPMSKKYGNMVHDEHLFIIIHQGNLNLT